MAIVLYLLNPVAFHAYIHPSMMIFYQDKVKQMI